MALLGFFDDEPAWARLLMLEAPVDRTVSHECRRGLHELLERLLDRDGGSDGPMQSPMLSDTLTGELLAGGVISVIRTTMLEDDGAKLVEVAPALIAFIGVHYGLPAPPRDTHEQRERFEHPARVSRAAELPIRATRRTTLVLCAIAYTPYSSNRGVAQAAGIADEGQTSKLLARLERKGVIENVGVGAARGEPNAWLLTASGRRAVELLGESFGSRAQATRMRVGGVA